MAHPAVALAESALRARKLDRTLTTALPSLERSDPAAVLPVGIPTVDASLVGGLPRGELSELAGPRSSGRTTLLLQVLASATARGEVTALIDTFDRLDVASVAAAQVDFDRLLWVRGQAVSRFDSATDPRWIPGESTGRESRATGLLERTVDRALKALNLVLQAGGFGVVAIDLADVPISALKRIPFTTWMRVQRTIESSDTACVLVVPEPLARSARGLTLTLDAEATWAGTADRGHRLAGSAMRVRVVSPRRRLDSDVRCTAAAFDDARSLRHGS